MRLVTRSDFDGLVCAVLIKQVEQIDAITFVHPKDLQDGRFEVTAEDVLTNVPFVEGCGLWFDHHLTEMERVVGKMEFQGACRVAPSAARVVYEYYGGAKRFPGMEELMAAVDKADSANFVCEDVLNPSGWTLLSFIMDARTGLGRYRDYRVSNYQLMYELIDCCTRLTIDEILQLPDVQERVRRYNEQDGPFREMVTSHSWTHGNVVVTDLRGVEPILCGNRFMVYALYPHQSVSIWIVSGLKNQNCVFALGRSIINRTSRADLGAICGRFGGGGHPTAGTCQIDHDRTQDTLDALVTAIHEADLMVSPLAA